MEMDITDERTRTMKDYPPHTFTADAGVLSISHEHVLDLRALSSHRTQPGQPVSISDLMAEALDAYMGNCAKELAAIAAEAEQAEAARVAAEHGAAA